MHPASTQRPPRRASSRSRRHGNSSRSTGAATACPMRARASSTTTRPPSRTSQSVRRRYCAQCGALLPLLRPACSHPSKLTSPPDVIMKKIEAASGAKYSAQVRLRAGHALNPRALLERARRTQGRPVQLELRRVARARRIPHAARSPQYARRRAAPARAHAEPHHRVLRRRRAAHGPRGAARPRTHACGPRAPAPCARRHAQHGSAEPCVSTLLLFPLFSAFYSRTHTCLLFLI